MRYRGYDTPIPVRYFDPVLGIGCGKALGVEEEPAGKGRVHFYFIIDSPQHGLVKVWQKHILAEGTK